MTRLVGTAFSFRLRLRRGPTRELAVFLPPSVARKCNFGGAQCCTLRGLWSRARKVGPAKVCIRTVHSTRNASMSAIECTFFSRYRAVAEVSSFSSSSWSWRGFLVASLSSSLAIFFQFCACCLLALFSISGFFAAICNVCCRMSAVPRDHSGLLEPRAAWRAGLRAICPRPNAHLGTGHIRRAHGRASLLSMLLS